MLISSTESLVPSVEGNLVHKLVRIAFFFLLSNCQKSSSVSGYLECLLEFVGSFGPDKSIIRD